MKFGKRLKQQTEETLPDWKHEFLSYKQLKKLVNLIPLPPPSPIDGYPNADTDQFFCLLNQEIEKLNSFFLGKEEDFIIRHQELQLRIQSVVATCGCNGRQPTEWLYDEEMAKIRKEIIDFHGEMVLLENYSTINYTGLVKILKKYDKRTGCWLRIPFIHKVLNQPFFVTDLVSKLIKECEHTIEMLFPVEEEEVRSRERNGSVTVAGAGIFRNTVVALATMQEIRNGSSTYGHLSLPPLRLQESDMMNTIQLTSLVETM